MKIFLYYAVSNCKTPTSIMQALIILKVRSISSSNPIENLIRPSLNPISACSSCGISDDVEVPGALNKVL